MRLYHFDAVVIGSGCAGYNCADWLHTLGMTNIAVVTESRNAGTSRNTGSDKQTYYKLSLSGDRGDSVLAMARTLFDGGAMDGDVALAEAANSARCFLKLANLGVPFPTNEYGEYVGYKTDHDDFCRATSIGPYTSKVMTEVLEAEVIRKGIAILDGLQAIEILTDGGAVTGVLCLDRRERDAVSYTAVCTPYVILATGGPAAIYGDSVYPASQTGSSALALQAGAQFANLSEWQYGMASTDFRWNVSGTYQQVLPRYISVDRDGVEREFLTRYFPTPAEMLRNIFLKGYEWPFDVRKLNGSSYIDLLVYQESVVLGRNVYLDFTREPSGLEGGLDSLDPEARSYLENSGALVNLPIQRLRRMNPGAIDLYASHGIDITRTPLKIAVCAQHNNGGIRIDAHWQTTVPGLYAIGEAAGSLGIFRPGGSALNSCQVGGLRAAEHIVYAGKNTVSQRFEAIAAQAVERADRLAAATRGERSTLAQARQRYGRRMSRSFAFLRDIPGMEAALAEIRADCARFEEDNRWTRYDELPVLFKNQDLLLMQEAVADTMLYAARNYGSRGSAFVLAGGDAMARQPLPENEAGRAWVTLTEKKDGICVSRAAVRPIPARDLWFERVWRQFNAGRRKDE